MEKEGLSLCIERDSIQERVPLKLFEEEVGVKFSSSLRFAKASIQRRIKRKIDKLHQKGELSRQQLWFGVYYREELDSHKMPDVFLRYIDPTWGWGVFANRNFKKMEWIAEYTGVLRRSRWGDRKNAYCFEYTLAPGVKTPYVIDARDEGGISRYLNHSDRPNLLSCLATVNGINRVILITSEPIEKGTQLYYDYGVDYWSCREPPLSGRN